MFPSLAALGGTLGLLGLREPELVGSAFVGNLNRGYQRHIDSCPVDYAALMRDPRTGLPTDADRDAGRGPADGDVALIGGGIANIIAASSFPGSASGARSSRPKTGWVVACSATAPPSSKAWSEAGADRFPRGGLMWHYVAQWVRAAGLDPEEDAIPAILPQPRHRPDHARLPGRGLRLGHGP